jgi:hypothetical protein
MGVEDNFEAQRCGCERPCTIMHNINAWNTRKRGRKENNRGPPGFNVPSRADYRENKKNIGKMMSIEVVG